jgi:hypothetical protein
MASTYQREYRVGPPIERGLDPRVWTLSRAPAGSRESLTVEFPWSLDRALLQRALTIARGDAPVAGDITVPSGERRWAFTPHGAWQAGDYALLAQPELEDVAGNRVGHAFETGATDADDARALPARIPFTIR